MLSFLSQHLDNEIRGTVDDLGMVGEIGRRVHKADDLHATLHLVEIAAAGIAHLCQDIECAQPRSLGSLFGGEVLANLTLIADLAVLAASPGRR